MRNVKLQAKSLKIVVGLYKENIKQPNKTITPNKTAKFNLDLKKFLTNKFDCLTNYNPPSFPDGLDIAIITFNSLKSAWKKAKSIYDCEHVIPYIINSPKFKKFNFIYF